MGLEDRREDDWVSIEDCTEEKKEPWKDSKDLDSKSVGQHILT